MLSGGVVAQLAGEGSKCNPSLPPECANVCAFYCEVGLNCYSETGLLGTSGTCLKEADIPTTTALPTLVLPPPPTLPPIEAPPTWAPIETPKLPQIEAPVVDISGSFQLHLGEATMLLQSAEAFCGDEVDLLAVKQGLAQAVGVDVSSVELWCEKAATIVRRLAARRLSDVGVTKYSIKVPLVGAAAALLALSRLKTETLTADIVAALAKACRPTDVTVLSMTVPMEGVVLPSTTSNLPISTKETKTPIVAASAPAASSAAATQISGKKNGLHARTIVAVLLGLFVMLAVASSNLFSSGPKDESEEESEQEESEHDFEKPGKPILSPSSLHK